MTIRGEVRARADVTANVGAGQLFLPMHHEATNRLTATSFDPHSRQPVLQVGGRRGQAGGA